MGFDTIWFFYSNLWHYFLTFVVELDSIKGMNLSILTVWRDKMKINDSDKSGWKHLHRQDIF